VSERELRALVADVRRGRLSRRRLRDPDGGARRHGTARRTDARAPRRSRAATPGLHAEPARRRRAAEGPLVAGADAAEPAFRDGHQGPGRRPHLLRARWRASIPTAAWVPILAAELPRRRQRRRRARRHLGGVASQERRHLARRQTLQRRRRRLQLGVRRRPGDLRVDARDVSRHSNGWTSSTPNTVKVVFKRPTPFWADAFCGARGMLIPRHVFEPYRGGKSREAPANLRPVGTGAYRFVDFKAGRRGARELNPAYHVPTARSSTPSNERAAATPPSAAAGGAADRRVRLRVEHAGGGRHPPAARAGRQGAHRRVADGQSRAHQLNHSDPAREIEGERSNAKSVHPTLSDAAVRAALNVLVDRGAIQEEIYGRGGRPRPTSSIAAAVRTRRTPPGSSTSSVPTSSSTRPAGGGAPTASAPGTASGCGFLFQTSINAPRQKNPGHRQAGVRARRHRAGAEVGRGLGVLFVRRGQPRHLPALLRGSPDCTTSR